MPINISTLNLCLGLKNKKLLVKKLLEENEIDVQCKPLNVITLGQRQSDNRQSSVKTSNNNIATVVKLCNKKN